MIKYTSITAIFILLITAFCLFQIKFYVQNLRHDITELNLQIKKEQDAIYMLRAEWTYLNQPDRLKNLVNKYLSLAPVKISQIHKMINHLPIYLSEDLTKKAQYLSSIELIHNRNQNSTSINLKSKNNKHQLNKAKPQIVKVKY